LISLISMLVGCGCLLISMLIGCGCLLISMLVGCGCHLVCLLAGRGWLVLFVVCDYGARRGTAGGGSEAGGTRVRGVSPRGVEVVVGGVAGVEDELVVGGVAGRAVGAVALGWAVAVGRAAALVVGGRELVADDVPGAGVDERVLRGVVRRREQE
jgi:hypothetical protein